MRWHWDPRDDDGIPDYVRTQVAWQMWVTDAADAHVAAMLCSPGDFKIWHVTRDRDLEAMIVGKMRAFWQKCQGEDPPVIDDSEECRAYLSAKYPRPADPVIRAATEEEEHMARERHGAAYSSKHADEVKKRLDNELIARIADNTGILGADGWKAVRKPWGKEGKIRYTFTAAKSWGAEGGEE
jgi:predicted phage-related endonuclease